MKKLITTILLSLCLLSLVNEAKADRQKEPELSEEQALAFLCSAHPRLGQCSTSRFLDKAVSRLILEKIAGPSLKINNADLEPERFSNLLRRFEVSNVTGLDLSNTRITNKQFCALLSSTRREYLREINLMCCYHVTSFNPLTHCTTLRVLNLSGIQINSCQLLEIARAISRTIKMLKLASCYATGIFDGSSSSNFAIHLTNLRGLDLSGMMNLTSEQLGAFLHVIGKNLRELNISSQTYLTVNLTTLKNCINLRRLNLSSNYIIEEQLVDLLNKIGAKLIKINIRSCYNISEEAKEILSKTYPHLREDFFCC